MFVLQDVLGADDDEEEEREVLNSTDSDDKCDASEQNSDSDIIESKNLLVDNCVEKTESTHSDEILQESGSDDTHTILKGKKYTEFYYCHKLHQKF